MNILEIKRAIESQLSIQAREHWHNTSEQNEYIIIAQCDGIDAAVEAIEEFAAN